VRLFDSETVNSLQPYLNRGDITFVGLGKYDFQCAFDQIQLSNTHKVELTINNQTYEWNERTRCEAPVWMLLGQIPKSCALVDETCIELRLRSGDRIRLYTEEGPYEASSFAFPKRHDTANIEVY
jgi:hypothetical protein